jgi:hypothetical protein
MLLHAHKKFFNSMARDGLLTTLLRGVRYPLKQLAQNWPKSGKAADVFSAIYERNLWRDSESVSGHGSTLESTANLRSALPDLLAKHGIKSVYDAPCGDFNWMSEVLKNSPVTYIGADIVPQLIERNRECYPDVTFKVANIAEDPFPQADLWLCRDCLFHLSYKDIFAALTRFAVSGVPFILTTTHRTTPFPFVNHDIRMGQFRLIDLFSPPFLLPADVLARIDDTDDPKYPRDMCLWTREQIAKALSDNGMGMG